MNRKERPYTTHEHQKVPLSNSGSMTNMESILEPISHDLGMMDVIPEHDCERNKGRELDVPELLLPPPDANNASRPEGSSSSASASAAKVAQMDNSRSTDTDSDFMTEMMSTYRDFIKSQYFPSPLLSSTEYASITDASSEHSANIDNTLSKRTNTLLNEFQDYLSQIDSHHHNHKSKSPSSPLSFSGSKDNKQEDPPEGNQQNNGPPFTTESERQLFDDANNMSSNSKEYPPDLESSSPSNNRQYFTGESSDNDNIASKNKCVNAIFNNLRGSLPLVGAPSSISQQISKRRVSNKRRSSSTSINDDDAIQKILWHNEMNHFQQATHNGRNERNLHDPEAGSDADTTTKQRYRNSRAAMIASCRRLPMCNNIAKHMMLALTLICAAIGSLAIILIGANMETKKDLLPKQLAKVFKQHEGSAPTLIHDHKPNWFDRSTNWKGQTYHEAIEFCESNSQVLCNAEIICPYGPGSIPILPNYSEKDGGFLHEKELVNFNSNNPSGLAWIPILGDTDTDTDTNNTNAWIQVGSRDICLRYDFIHNGQSPAWGITGEDNEEITRHIACCPPPPITGKQQQHEQPSSSPPAMIVPMLYEYEHFELEHTWYNNSEGWNGSTIRDAHDFCSSKESRFPCPYELYCPKGPHHRPVEGGPDKGEVLAVSSSSTTTSNSTSSLFETKQSKSWAPIIDEFGNGIVQIGLGGSLNEDEEAEKEDSKKKNDMCKVYHLSTEDELSGMGFEESTHVMCCRKVDGYK